jgi:SAM-dependent methyltransferase
MALDPGSLERLIPDEIPGGDMSGQGTLALHLARYEFAARHMRPGRLLDIACGTGYGTHLLGDRGQGRVDALGVDISDEAIAYARRRYGNDRVRFLAEDAMRFSDPEGFDTIVSLETIEHVPRPHAFLARLVGLLRAQGVLIGSVPTTLTTDANPYHCHDFTETSFRMALRRHGLREVSCLRQSQSFNLFPLITRKEPRFRDLRPHLSLYYLPNPA